MVVNKHEAAQALRDIDSARQRIQSMQHYRAAAPYFLIWGCIYLLANCITSFSPVLGVRAWRVLAIVGWLLSIGLNAYTARQRSANRLGWQIGATWLLIFGFFAGSFAVLPHLDARQGNAFISLFWAFLYAVMGLWTGWRILTVGILTAASILVGYFMITSFYFLWMGLVTGGLLILGGLWLRKV